MNQDPERGQGTSQPHQGTSANHESPWYEHGLRFRCTGCGKCCSGFPGVVWISPHEAANLADFLDLTPTELEHRYLRRIQGGRTLIDRSNGDCVFYVPQTRTCRVYDARPAQCRSWPFWSENVETEEAWQNTQAFCPGSGEGDLIDAATITKRIRQRADAKQKAHG